VQESLLGCSKEEVVIVRTLKLKLTHKQEATLEQWLWHLTGVYNWGLKKIEHNAANKIYFAKFDFVNLLANHGKKLDIPSHTLHGTLQQVHNAWQRCFRKIAKKPRMKGKRNKLNSIPFPDPIKSPKDNRISIPGIGRVRYYKQELPEGKIKCGRIVKRASGWYLCLWLEAEHKFAVKETDKAVGIDPGFDTLLTLSDGTKIENPRELRKGEQRLAQSQRSNDKHLTARLLERQNHRRRDRNHKISRWLIENYKTIYYSDDNFKGMARKFGKSVTEAGLNQLIGMMNYKGRIGGREVKPVNSFRTTMTCSVCGALTGPTGLAGLQVRQWECSACGAVHDRDYNSSRVVLNAGLGISHERGLRNVA
jgi:putative transposase